MYVCMYLTHKVPRKYFDSGSKEDKYKSENCNKF